MYIHTYTCMHIHTPVCVYVCVFDWTFMYNYFRVNNRMYFGA